MKGLKVAGVAVIVMVMAGIMGIGYFSWTGRVEAKPRVYNEITARAFFLEDKQGRSRACLRMNEDGPFLGLFDEQGRFKLGLSARPKASVINIWDNEGRMGLELVVREGDDGAVKMVFFKDKERPGIMASLPKRNGPFPDDEHRGGFYLYRSNGSRIWSVP